MILYLDTSSLVKAYLLESGWEAVNALREQARIVATSLVAYAESRATLARSRRGGRLTPAQFRMASATFEADWNSFSARDVTVPLVRQAGDLAEKHVLRGFDAIHLASALTLQRELGEDVTFSAADGRLMSAASVEGLLVAVGS